MPTHQKRAKFQPKKKRKSINKEQENFEKNL